VPDPYVVPFRTMDELHAWAYGFGDAIAKTNAPILSGTTAAWNAIYGKRVWSQLNYEANTFAMLPKQPWANSGWRTETGFPGKTTAAPGTPWTRGTAPSGGVVEDDGTNISAVPDTIRPSWDKLVAKPKQIWHGFDVSEIMDFLSGVDDSVDAMPVMREEIGKFHALMMDAMLMADADTVSDINLETLDRIICSYSEWNNTSLTGDDGNPWDVSAANQVNRQVTTDSFYDSYVGHNNDVDRTLTLSIIDTALENIWLNGGKPKVIVTGYDTLMAWQQLLQAQRRYMEAAQVVATFGGIRSVAPGYEGGFMVSTYHGIPIIPSQNVYQDTKSRIYFLDTDYLWIRVARPTQYFESRDMILLGKIGYEGAYRTVGETMCKNFKAQGKVRDLK